MRQVELRDSIHHIDELSQIIGAMRSLAAVRMRKARESIDAIRRYADVVEAGVRDAMRVALPDAADAADLVADAGARHVIVLCSEHGFCGRFNDLILDHLDQEVRHEGAHLGVVGSRGIRLARARGLTLDWAIPMATHAESVPDTARDIEAAAFGQFVPGEVTRLEVLSATIERGTVEPTWQTLFPLDLSAFADADANEAPPLHYLPTERLLDELFTEYVLADITRVTMESFLAENTARLHAMEAANENIDRRLDELRHTLAQLRQRGITEELLDIVNGAEAIQQSADEDDA